MACRLADLVVHGEINNTQRNSVHGWLKLRGSGRTVVLSLTGNCDADLAGRRFSFEPQRPFETEIPEGGADESESAELERLGLGGFSLQQIGPTGCMTAARKVRVADCSTKELIRRFELGEPPPMEWKQCLYLEWYSQNGRVVIEMPDPKIEFMDDGPVDDMWTGAEDDLEYEQDSMQGGMDVTSIKLDEDGEPEIHSDTLFAGEDELDDESDEADDYGLISADLQRHLDAQSTLTDWALRESARDDDSTDDSEDFGAEMELMDALIENGEGEPLANIFKGVVKLPPPDSLSDEEAEQQLKVVLGRMAMFGVALHMCEHFTAREAYRLIVEEYCQEECFHPELQGTHWVQHFDTAEHCDMCMAEFEKDEDDPPADCE